MSTPQANQIDLQKIDARLETVTEFILTKQMDNSGAWPLKTDINQPNTEATALALLWLVRYAQTRTAPGDPLLEKIKRKILKGLKYLCDQQRPDTEQTDRAGWGDQPGGPVRVLPTSMAVFALARYLSWQSEQGKNPEQAYIDALNKGLNWLDANISQHWNRRVDQKHLAAKVVYWTCTALREANLVGVIWNSDIQEFTLPHAFSVVRSASKPKGGWGAIFLDPPELAPSAYLTYLLLRYSENSDPEPAKNGLKYVKQEFERLDFQSHPPVEDTARAILTMREGGEDCQSDKIRQGIQYLLSSYEESTYGWCSSHIEKPDLSATHSACRALLEYRKNCT